MTPAQLDRALGILEPRLRRAILKQLEACRVAANRVALDRVEAAIRAGDVRGVVRLLLGDAVAETLTVAAPQLPDGAIAFRVPAPAAIAATSLAEQALLRAAAEAAIQASRIASASLPPVPPTSRVRAPASPNPAPTGVLTATLITPTPSVAAPPAVAVPTAAQREGAALRYAGEALRYLRAEIRDGIVATIEAGNAAGRNPVEIARSLRDTVGLGRSQAQWVANLRTELEAGRYRDALARQLVKGPIRSMIAARMRSRRDFTPAEIDKIVADYAGKWRAWHAETIARTTSLDLLRAGQLARAREAVASGAYGDKPVTKTWRAMIDDRTRDQHRALDGATVPLEGQWLDESTRPATSREVPGGWNCRCSMVIRVGV